LFPSSVSSSFSGIHAHSHFSFFSFPPSPLSSGQSPYVFRSRLQPYQECSPPRVSSPLPLFLACSLGQDRQYSGHILTIRKRVPLLISPCPPSLPPSLLSSIKYESGGGVRLSHRTTQIRRPCCSSSPAGWNEPSSRGRSRYSSLSPYPLPFDLLPPLFLQTSLLTHSFSSPPPSSLLSCASHRERKGLCGFRGEAQWPDGLFLDRTGRNAGTPSLNACGDRYVCTSLFVCRRKGGMRACPSLYACEGACIKGKSTPCFCVDMFVCPFLCVGHCFEIVHCLLRNAKPAMCSLSL
jgi:hypothetical protein